jgi:xanthine/CO dehydrogenase XdhC/CoxF family maturation factor
MTPQVASWEMTPAQRGRRLLPRLAAHVEDDVIARCRELLADSREAEIGLGHCLRGDWESGCTGGGMELLAERVSAPESGPSALEGLTVAGGYAVTAG